jgi:hypothetical protein
MAEIATTLTTEEQPSKKALKITHTKQRALLGKRVGAHLKEKLPQDGLSSYISAFAKSALAPYF